MSFLENENQMVIDATYSEIGEMLVEDWVNANLDEGQLYADFRFAEMSDSNYFDAMTNTSQSLNPAYGYLWWLNGKSSFHLPQSQPHCRSPMLAAIH